MREYTVDVTFVVEAADPEHAKRIIRSELDGSLKYADRYEIIGYPVPLEDD